jgi:L-ascorbate metabolism protein UlaG (beta-lactamase superfamily)
MIKIQYVGHSTLLIETNIKIMIDPYLKGEGREGLSRHNPNAVLSVEEVNPDIILLTHGHGDHFGQTLELLERTDARLVASNKVSDFVEEKLGGQKPLRIEPNKKLEIGKITLLALEAKHKHGLEGFGGDILGWLAFKRYTPCGTNMGYVISIEGKEIYHSGDTHVVKGVHNPHVAFLGMDGLRTLNENEAMEVIKEIKPKIAVPIHYKWYYNGQKIVSKVKETIERNEVDVSFREMVYGEEIHI